MTPQQLYDETTRYMRPLRYPDKMCRTGERPQTPREAWLELEHSGWRMRTLSTRAIERVKARSAVVKE